MSSPIRLSVSISTWNNQPVLQRALESWRKFAYDKPIEIIVIADGCRDNTVEYLRSLESDPWAKSHVRWMQNDENMNEVYSNNQGLRAARGDLILIWHDDMFLEVDWLVDELIETFDRYPEIGIVGLIRGLNLFPQKRPILEWKDLHEEDLMVSTRGYGAISSYFRLAEVDIIVRPWVVRREIIEQVGPLDEAFRPIEWDEADLCYRLRAAGWKVATYGYERLGAFTHLGSSTIKKIPPLKHQAAVLPKGQLFHERWQPTIAREHPRQRRTWARRLPLRSLPRLFSRAAYYFSLKLARPRPAPITNP
jgi:GT2 family glycosyltransferase